MAEIISNENGAHKKGKQRAKKQSTFIDMTPMVDLMCLLLTFFMLTTAFIKPKVMEIVMPEKGEPRPIPKNRVVNIILDGNSRIFYYFGLADQTKPPIPDVYESDFSKEGIRKTLMEKNKVLFKKIEELNADVTKGKIILSKESLAKKIKDLRSSDSLGPIVLIKATEKAKYKNIIDIADEMVITNVARYAIVDMNSFEKRLLAKTKKDLGIRDDD
jgi:biopolymer transport protein ExbD